MQGLTSEMHSLCPNTCTMTTTNVPVAQWATGLGTAAANLLQRNPNINYMMPSFGAMVTPVLATLKRVDPTGKIPVSSFDQEPELIPELTAGRITADVGTSFGALAWPTIDQALRIESGQKPVVEAGPVRMVTTALGNKLGLSASKSDTANNVALFGDLVTGQPWLKLWGVR